MRNLQNRQNKTFILKPPGTYKTKRKERLIKPTKRKPSIKKKITVIFLLVSIALCSDLFAERPSYANQRRPKIGLVLGGGGARGAAHVGVLRVLEENRVPIDYVVGTSMGSIVGGLYASGVSVEELGEIFESIDWKGLFTDRPSRKDLPFRHKQDRRKLIDFEMGFNKGKLSMPKGIIAGQKLEFILKSKTLHVTGVEDFNQLSIPYRAVAADIETGQKVVLDRGNLAEAIRASMSVPGVFSPVEIDNHILVDGGIVDNLPVDVVRDMGADIVIAVDVGTKLTKREQLKSALDISMQVISILTLQNVNEQISKLTKKDLLITPELGDTSSSDFHNAPEIVKIGEESARNFTKQLERYSVSDEEYQIFLTKQRKKELKSIKIDFMEVTSTGGAAPQRIQAKVKTKSNTELDLDVLQEDLTRIYAMGEFEKADFKILEKQDKTGLLINTTEKSWGPNYLRFGLNITDDFEGDSYYNFLTEYTRTQVNALGAEWKTEAQIGRTRKVLTQFYQPLDYADRFFIVPSIEYSRSVSDIFEGDTRTAQYKLAYLQGGLDAGINIGTCALGKIGIVRGNTEAGPLVGGESLPEFNIDTAALTSEVIFDQIDDSNFPKYGITSDAYLFLSQRGLGADESYKKLQFQAIKATTFGGRHTFLADIEGGANLGKEIPFYDEFTIGGFLSLSGYRKGQLRGQYFGLGRLVYYYKVANASSGLADAIYIGGSAESGNVWDKSNEIEIGNLLHGGSVFLGVDNIFGPLYLGYGLAEDSEEGRFYLFLGQTF